ncbi:transaldolase family protein [Halanaerobacter jeridensis]|uniref:Fructose-6-phosphate aldolase 2 n=1 Tax=Halanaerobacter jeridensis TaxID=706427 RepID=A0A939BS99_9FIRM|nr:transaldolase family protein [Halanaerobacter jeridensis]MBM7556911.1 fructose-6-phosphate aldolase 2 [Halanaerobacter jeridensis]
MLYLLDTAELSEIKRCLDLYPIAGVTTNPSIIAQENRPYLELLKEIKDVLGSEKMLYVQVLAQKSNKMIVEAKHLKEELGANTYIKIPVISEGIKAIKTLNKIGIKTTATAVFTPQQAVMAARAGADFVAPYVNRIDNISAKGVRVVSEIVKNFRIHNLDSQVISASFRNVEQINNCCLAGSDAITANPELIEKLLTHPMTDEGVRNFVSDWEAVYNRKELIK